MSTHTVTAVVDNVDDARHLVEQLSLAGIDGRVIEVVDPAAPATPPGRRSDRATDARVVGRLVRRLAIGLAAGLTLGILALFAAGQQVPSVPAWQVVGALAGLGATVAVLTLPVMAPAWEDANRPGAGVRHVLVREVGPQDLQTVRRILAEARSGPA